MIDERQIGFKSRRCEWSSQRLHSGQVHPVRLVQGRWFVRLIYTIVTDRPRNAVHLNPPCRSRLVLQLPDHLQVLLRLVCHDRRVHSLLALVRLRAIARKSLLYRAYRVSVKLRDGDLLYTPCQFAGKPKRLSIMLSQQSGTGEVHSPDLPGRVACHSAAKIAVSPKHTAVVC